MPAAEGAPVRPLAVPPLLRAMRGGLVLAALALCAPSAGASQRRAAEPPEIQREFRGVWVSTAFNIDWPSRPGLPAEQQRAELRALFDRAAAAGLNAVVFQVRPAADALYPSELEPWGAMLTGRQGSDPGYDPLAFAVAEAHQRGLELHAWVNPFAAGMVEDSARLAPNHVLRTRPELVRVYGTQLWMDPGEPAVHGRTMAAVLDVVKRYDLDAVHLDDYFYPYPVRDSSGRVADFPDSASYARHGAGTPRAAWRRANIDRFVERLYREVHAAKPHVRVGISPFGIWRPGTPPGITGLDAYGEIYADSRKWLANGWVDYLAPQLYWAVEPPQQSFPALLGWWMAQNTRARHLWPGIAAYRVFEEPDAYPVAEVVRQAGVARGHGATGLVFYNARSTLLRDSGAVASAVASAHFERAALPPATPWLDSRPPPAPALRVALRADGSATLSLAPAPSSERLRWWVVRHRASGRWTTRVAPAGLRTLPLAGAPVDHVVVQAVDLAGNASTEASWSAP